MSTHYKGTALEQDILNCWIKLNRAHSSVSQTVKANMDGHGLTITQFGVLEILEHLGPQTLKVIGEKSLMTSSNMVTVVDNLERDGYVKRERNPSDRRSTIISLTEKGSLLIKEVFRSHLDELVNAFDCLNQDEMHQLGDVCKKLGLNQNK